MDALVTIEEQSAADAKKKGDVIQNPFLNALRRERVPVSVYLVNGIKLQGVIESFDNYVILLKNTVTQAVYKHAVSTIVPGRPLKNYPVFSQEEATELGIRMLGR